MTDQVIIFLQIVFIDLVLAGDNAIIIGMVASQFPLEQRKKIIFWGIGAAVVLRIIFTLITAYLLQITGLRLIGGILLLYICYKLYVDVLKNNHEDKKDISKAVKTLNRLGKYTFSQGAVVRNKKVIAREGKGGTQKMLKKCKRRKFRKQGVLVKFPKKKQDLRIDLPTVGLKTLIDCKSSGLKGVVLKNKQNIFLERKKCINFVNKNKMFIMVK